MALTERQQQIKGLLKQGKSAKEIGKDLDISENAVYQQIRRMRKAGENVGTKRATGSRSTPKRGRQAARPAAAPGADLSVCSGRRSRRRLGRGLGGAASSREDSRRGGAE